MLSKTMLIPLLLTGLASMLVISFCLFTRTRSHRRQLHQELMDLLGQEQYQFTIIDVRDSREFEKEHISMARNMPFSPTMSFFPSENIFERIIVFGPNDRIARITARKISMNGYFNVSSYGAYHRWKGPKS